MTSKPYPSKLLTEVGEMLLDEDLTLEQIAYFAVDLLGECKAIRDNRNEAAWMRQQESLMESGGPDNSGYRRDMIATGRGYLLR